MADSLLADKVRALCRLTYSDMKDAGYEVVPRAYDFLNITGEEVLPESMPQNQGVFCRTLRGACV